jgi:hypothetical protein
VQLGEAGGFGRRGTSADHIEQEGRRSIVVAGGEEDHHMIGVGDRAVVVVVVVEDCFSLMLGGGY